MASVNIFNNFEKSLRRFKKKCIEEGILQEVKERQYFTSKSEKRKKAKAFAKARWKRKMKEKIPTKF